MFYLLKKLGILSQGAISAVPLSPSSVDCVELKLERITVTSTLHRGEGAGKMPQLDKHLCQCPQSFYQGCSLVALAPASLLSLNGRASGLATRRSQVRLLMVSGQRSAMMKDSSFEAGQFSVIYGLFCMFKQVSFSCKNSCCSKRYLKNVILLNSDLCVCVLMNNKAVIE